jgi:hypothetical protein
MLPVKAPPRVPRFGGKSFEVNASMLHGHNFGKWLGMTFLAPLEKKRLNYTDFVIFGNYLVLAAKKNHEKKSAWRKIVKLCRPPSTILARMRAKNQVKIRPLGCKNPSMSPQRKACLVVRRGHLRISLL